MWAHNQLFQTTLFTTTIKQRSWLIFVLDSQESLTTVLFLDYSQRLDPQQCTGVFYKKELFDIGYFSVRN